jgi:hypothetical protein
MPLVEMVVLSECYQMENESKSKNLNTKFFYNLNHYKSILLQRFQLKRLIFSLLVYI